MTLPRFVRKRLPNEPDNFGICTELDVHRACLIGQYDRSSASDGERYAFHVCRSAVRASVRAGDLAANCRQCGQSRGGGLPATTGDDASLYGDYRRRRVTRFAIVSSTGCTGFILSRAGMNSRLSTPTKPRLAFFETEDRALTAI